MKTIRRILLCGMALAASFYFVHAQTAVDVSSQPVMTDPNEDVSNLSDEEVELKAIEMTTPISAADLPQAGTFWSAQHAPGSPDAWPPLPSSFGMAAWSLGDDGVFLLDDLSKNYNVPVKTSLNASSGMMMDAMDSSGVGGDGSDSGGGGVPPINTPNYGTNLWLSIAGVSNSFANLFLENTAPSVQYEIQSKQDLTQTGWDSEGFVLGSEFTNWTPMNVAQNGRTNLFFRIRSWADDGSGLPIWWQLQYFGTTGVNPNALDSANDGWTIYQKYIMGVAPNTFVTPPAPQGVTVNFNSFNNTAAINWQPSPGPVTGYTVEKYDGWTGQTTDYNLAANVVSLVNNVSADIPDPFQGSALVVSYKVQAQYAGGSSSWSSSLPLEPNTVSASIVGGSQDAAYVTTTPLPSGTTTLLVTLIDEAAWFDYYYFGIGTEPINPTFEIPVTNSAQSQFLIPTADADIPPASDGGNYFWYVQTLKTNGNLGAPAGSLVSNGQAEPPWFDGRAQLKENLIFLLRAAMVDSPFGYYVGDSEYGSWYEFLYPNNYAFSGFYQTFDQYGEQQSYGTFDPLLPFENNYFYRNFVFNLSNVNQGFPTTGIWGAYTPYLVISNSPVAYQFQAPATNGAVIPPLLSTNDARWLGAGDYIYGSTWIYSPNYEIGVSQDGSGNYHLGGNNYFGLPFVSVEIAYPSGSGTATTTLNAGGSTSQGGYFYSEVAQPQFQTVGYYFWNPSPPFGYPTPFPGTTGFSGTNPSDLFIASPQGVSVVGYAKLAVENGNSGVYGYLGQYFDQAYQINTNGAVTTNSAGVLSPYGNFFPAVPGPAALVTMPDIDTGQRGTCTVYCVSLALDKNHDGNMDTSFNGADATSASSPYTHWCDNNYDRFVVDADDNTSYDDDVKVQDSPGTPGQNTPDCNYLDGAGHRAIPCVRDLQDFARLWVCGVTSNLLAALPAGSTITLNWGDVGSPNSGNPTIDLFQAADPDGGIGYLTNSTIADSQIDSLTSAYVGRLAPGGSILLNSSLFSGWAGNHFIWCGVTNGSGQLNLTIADASGNVLAQASQWIQIVDIKQMYERWTVGDDPSQAPQLLATNVTDGLPPFVSAFQYTPPPDTNTPYILFVHGWNMQYWEKDRFAESAFKRLYWQGYQGRFGEFRWPTGYGFTGSFWDALTDPRNFDNSEYQAWQSAAGLLNKLNDLNAEYPNHVYMLAHSMGNVVAGEALRLAAQDGDGQLVNTYVASQAALPAHDYDSTVTTPYLLAFTYTYPSGPLNSLGSINYGPNTPNIYGNRLTNNVSAVGKRINFYNTNDFALAAPRWGFDQITKPDTIVGEGSYYYNGSITDPAPWNHFQFLEGAEGTINFDIVGNLNNLYTVMSYAAEPRSTALGATPNVLNISENLDLTTVWPTDTSGHSYGDHFWHSAEFRGDCWQEWNYWNILLFSSQYGFNISNP